MSEPREESILDDGGAPRIEGRQLSKRRFELQEINRLERASQRICYLTVERHMDRRPAPTPLGVPALRIVDQDSTHRDRRDRQEVRPTLPLDLSVARHLQIRLVDQRRGVEGVIRAFRTELGMREAIQVLVELRENAIDGCPVAAERLGEEVGSLGVE